MTRDVLYSDVNFKSYFDMRKFENSIYNKEIVRERRIGIRRKQKIVDNIITFVVVIFSVMVLGLFGMIAYQSVKLATIDYQINKLEDTLASAIKNNEGESETLEKVITDCPMVKECAVVVVPDKEKVTTSKAFVVLNDDYFDTIGVESKIRECISDKLLDYQMPGYFAFLNEIPLMKSGKINYSQLEKM